MYGFGFGIVRWKCKYKLEIEKKLENIKENPKDEEIKLKEELIKFTNEIDTKFQEGKISFFYYILSKHTPNVLEENMKFNDQANLEYA